MTTQQHSNWLLLNQNDNRRHTSIVGACSDFAKESFLDWCQDMEDTDWSYLEVSDTEWMKALLAKGFGYVCSNLELYRRDFEKSAYADGYLPDTKGADVRNWSQELTNYLT